MRLRTFTCLVLALGLALTASLHRAVAAPAGPFVKGLADQVLALFNDPRLSFAQREQRMHDIAVNNFDVPYSARFTLGSYWRQATDSEREDYRQAFEGYIVHFYSLRFDQYHDVGFVVDSERSDTPTDSVVRARIIRRDGRPPIVVDWRVTTASGTPKIRDVIIEGVSQLLTLRDDFSASIQRDQGGVAGLTRSLRQKSLQ